MKHHISHAPRPPPPRRNYPLPSQRPPQIETPNKRRFQGGVTNFLFNTLSIILPGIWVRPTPKFAGVPAEEDLRTIRRRPPNRAEAPNREKYDTPGQTTSPYKLLFDFSLIYTVLRKAGMQEEQESPFSLEAVLPKHYPAPQCSQTDQKKPGPESARDRGSKLLNLNSAWTNMGNSIYHKRDVTGFHFE